MRDLTLFIICILISACGQDRIHTEVKEICSSDSPPLVLPDEVVCNHAPANNIQVTGKEFVYMCTKISGGTIEYQEEQ